MRLLLVSKVTRARHAKAWESQSFAETKLRRDNRLERYGCLVNHGAVADLPQGSDQILTSPQRPLRGQFVPGGPTDGR